MMDQKNSPLWDWTEPTVPAGQSGDWGEEENTSWEAAWIDLGGEG